MTEIYQIVFEVSPQLYERMQARAIERRHGVDEWVLRAVIRTLLQPEFAIDRCVKEAAAKAAIKRNPHVAHS